MAGSGAGGDLLDPGMGGAVRGMWRAVYRKAVEAAEPRIRSLLQEHVYSYHLGLGGGGGGGGGGGWVLLYEHEVTAASELILRLPASGSLAQTHSSLVLELRGRSTATGNGRDNVTLQVNADSAYNYGYSLTRTDGGTVTGFAAGTDLAADVGALPRAGVTASTGAASGYATVRFPMYARTDVRKGWFAESGAPQGSSGSVPYSQQAAGWVVGTTDAITALLLRPGFGEFAQGTLVRVWGVTGTAA